AAGAARADRRLRRSRDRRPGADFPLRPRSRGEMIPARLPAPVVLAAVIGLTMTGWAQMPADAPQLKILSPGEEAYVTGATLLRARVDPPEAVVGLTSFVAARRACTLPRPPFECDWDAGATIAEHQV